MLYTAQIDLANTITESDIANFLTNATFHSTYHTVVKTLPGAAIFGLDMLFDGQFFTDWSKVVEYRQTETDKNIERENIACVNWGYQCSDKYFLKKTVSSTKLKADMKVFLGSSCQFIQMEP